MVIDRLVRRPGIERRLTDSVETALKLAEGVVEIEIVPREGDEAGETLTFSQHLACPIGHESYEELAPRNFSFNSPYGACEHCDGLGTRYEVDPELVVPNPDLGLGEGAIGPWRSATSQYFVRLLESVAEAQKIPLDKPWSKLTKKQTDAHPLRRQGRGHGQVQEPLRPLAPVQDGLRGRHPVAAAPPHRHRVRLEPRKLRVVHA